MPSLKSILGAATIAFAAVASALPAQPKLSERAVTHYNLAARQNAAAAAAGITDIDILQFALTLEFLESAFYREGFAKFPDSDFTALGLSDLDLKNLKDIGRTESTHVTTLLTGISAAGFRPVAPCQYNFGFTTAAAMVATAAVLENVGVSAYLGAAPLVADPKILTIAAEIVTVEARHQTFIRTASKVKAVASPFDTPLGVQNVFTLAAPFISSCPEGSNLNIKPLTAVTLSSPAAGTTIKADDVLTLSTTASGAKFCAFTNGGVPGGTAFTELRDGKCVVPQILNGIAYLNLASEGPLTGVLTDAITVAGTLVIMIS